VALPEDGAGAELSRKASVAEVRVSLMGVTTAKLHNATVDGILFVFCDSGNRAARPVGTGLPRGEVDSSTFSGVSTG